jgi:hypothetical protein
MKEHSRAGPYPRSFCAWQQRDEKALRGGIERGLDLFELAALLCREPIAVLRHLDAAGLFEAGPDTDEQIELLALAMSAVLLQEAIRWCAADPARLHYTAIDSMRKRPDPKAALVLAREHKIWDVDMDSLEDLRWLAAQPVEAVAAADT